MSHLQLSEFQIMAVQAALTKMFNSRMFDICTVRDVAEVLGVKLESADFNTLRLFHCIQFKDMTPQVQRQVRDMTLSLLGIPVPASEFVEEVVEESKAGSFARWLLGVKK